MTHNSHFFVKHSDDLVAYTSISKECNSLLYYGDLLHNFLRIYIENFGI